MTGRVRTPVVVLMVATRTKLSLPGCNWMTLARGHLVGNGESLRRITISPTAIFLREFPDVSIILCGPSLLKVKK